MWVHKEMVAELLNECVARINVFSEIIGTLDNATIMLQQCCKNVVRHWNSYGKKKTFLKLLKILKDLLL